MGKVRKLWTMLDYTQPLREILTSRGRGQEKVITKGGEVHHTTFFCFRGNIKAG